jgi:hypothetical protein
MATTPTTSADITDFSDAAASEIDINGLAEKTTPIAADLLLLSDSAAAHAKKKLQISNLAGCNVEYAESVGEDSHTGDTNWQDKISKTFTATAGDWEIEGFALTSGDDAGKLYGLRIDVDGSAQYATSTRDLPSKKRADGMWMDRTAKKIVTLTAASHTIKLQYNVSDAGKTVYIKEATLIIKKVG